MIYCLLQRVVPGLLGDTHRANERPRIAVRHYALQILVSAKAWAT